jgi:hypothetical protein
MGYYKVDDRVHAIPPKTLSWVQKNFYSRMHFRCNHKNKSWWSNEQLAQDFYTSKRNIQRWCRHLESLGMLKIHRTDGRRNEISMPKLTDEKFLELGVPMEVLMKLRGDKNVTGGATPASPGGDSGDTPIIKEKAKTKTKTGGRATLEEMWGDPDVAASGERAVAASKKRGAMPCVTSPGEVSVSPPAAPKAAPDESRLARWSMKNWSDEFIARMKKAGYEVSFAKYKAVQTHVGAIRDHLLNRGFSRLKIYRFLLEWFPDVYSSICSSVFKKSPEDFMFSVAWMEPRLDELVRLYEERDREPPKAPKVTVMD